MPSSTLSCRPAPRFITVIPIVGSIPISIPGILNCRQTRALPSKALSTTAPAGVALWVTAEGCLQKIGLREGQTIIARGVPLRANIEVVGDVVVGEIAESFVVAGEQRPAGTKVSIDLAAGSTSLAGSR